MGSAAAMTPQQLFDDGNRLFRDDLYWAALLRYGQAEEAGMNTALLHYNTGVAHYKAGQHIRARESLEKATRSSALQPMAHFNLGLNAYATGDAREAIRWFKLARDQQQNKKVSSYARKAIARIRETERSNDPVIQRVDKPQQTAHVSSEILDSQPPSSVEAEHCVLGSILLLPECCDDVAMKLRPDDFYDEANQKLYKHLLSMHDAGRKIDLALLVEQLKSSGDYESIGGAAYLARIGSAVPNAAHADYYAAVVQRKATFRRLIQVSTEILRDAYGEAEEARELLNTAEQKIFAILERGSDGEGLAHTPRGGPVFAR